MKLGEAERKTKKKIVNSLPIHEITNTKSEEKKSPKFIFAKPLSNATTMAATEVEKAFRTGKEPLFSAR